MAFKGGSLRRASGELQEVLRATLKPVKTLKEVLGFLLDVLEMLLDVLDLSWMSWTCPGGTRMSRMSRMATILPSQYHHRGTHAYVLVNYLITCGTQNNRKTRNKWKSPDVTLRRLRHVIS